MKVFRSSCPGKYLSFWIRVPLITFAIMFFSSGAYAEDLPQKKSTDQAAEQIQIVADKLITNSTEKFAEFVGDVQASQGNLVINSERLRIYYRDDPARNKNQTGGQESIKRIIASGNVQVSSEEYEAKSDQAEYDLDTQVLTFTGENSTMKSGKNIVTGSKISVDRKNGQIKVEGIAHERVKAVFYPEEKPPAQNTKE